MKLSTIAFLLLISILAGCSSRPSLRASQSENRTHGQENTSALGGSTWNLDTNLSHLSKESPSILLVLPDQVPLQLIRKTSSLDKFGRLQWYGESKSGISLSLAFSEDTLFGEIWKSEQPIPDKKIVKTTPLFSIITTAGITVLVEKSKFSSFEIK